MLADVSPGAIVQLRKPHPCGSDRWHVERTGADVRLRCLGCGRRVLLPLGQLDRRLRAVWAEEGAAGTAEHDHR
ncbi:MAG: DUF951 domain-containing protein [Dehalococcoidia bacterium]|nr:DUF951 domain-containing protein [Dehalococcoidia bacterium]MDW8008546.1 DUF951 domain-containing protein [Chloroflexota bacterium]